MNKCRILIVLASTLLIVAGCGSDQSEALDSGQFPAAASIYAVTITEIEIVNKDSGETVAVDGLPASGGLLGHE